MAPDPHAAPMPTPTRRFRRRPLAAPRTLGFLAACLAAGLLLAALWRPDLSALDDPPRSAAVLTGGTWASMVYVARVEGGVIAIDLGFDGDGDALRRALARLDATPDEVVAVFLTHGHRDHVAAWRAVSRARFYLGAGEVPRFLGREEHRGWVPRTVDRLVPVDLPDAAEVDLVGFASDTVVAFGADTVRLFPVPGHTPGSAAYLFRGTLFTGDAVAWTPVRGFHSAKRIYSDDVTRSRASLAVLWDRLGDLPVARVCTAHGRCAAPTPAFRRATLR